VSRLKQLEARRRVLLARCAAQRVELAERLGELDPLTVLRGAGGGGSGISALRHPLAWAAALAGLLFLGRTREVLTFVLWVRSALSLAGRVAQIVRLATQLRSPRAERESAAPRDAATDLPGARG
jgi:hypothetical protein